MGSMQQLVLLSRRFRCALAEFGIFVGNLTKRRQPRSFSHLAGERKSWRASLSVGADRRLTNIHGARTKALTEGLTVSVSPSSPGTVNQRVAVRFRCFSSYLGGLHSVSQFGLFRLSPAYFTRSSPAANTVVPMASHCQLEPWINCIAGTCLMILFARPVHGIMYDTCDRQHNASWHAPG